MENSTKRLLTKMLKITFGSREKAGNCCLKTATKFQFSVKHRWTFLKHLKYKERYTTLLNVLSVFCMCQKLTRLIMYVRRKLWLKTVFVTCKMGKLFSILDETYLPEF